MTESTQNRMTPAKARLVCRLLVLSGFVMILAGGASHFFGAAPIVLGVLIFTGLLDVLLGAVLFPKIFERQMKREEERFGPL